MKSVVTSTRFVHRVSVTALWICVVLFGSLQESCAQLTFVEEPQDTKVLLGKEVSLNCTATATGSKKIRYNWLFMGSKISSGSRVIVQSDGTLRITKAEKRDSGDYICVAVSRESKNNRIKKKSKKAILTVQSICSTSKIDKVPNSAPYASATDLELRCICSGTPIPSIVWTKDGKPVKIGGRLSTSSTSLNIKKLEIADSGNYECSATNVLASRKSPAANIQVINAREPVFDEKPKDQYAKLGQSLTLTCKASGKPKPSITWFYDTFADALVNSSKHTITNDGSIIISNIEFSDFGDYKCRAKNIVNSLSATAMVSEAYIRDISFSSVKFVEVGEAFSLLCNLRGEPKPGITWEMASGGALPASYANNKGSLENNKVKISDSGNFTCIAKNAAGTRSANLQIIASVFPSFIAQPQDTLANENAKVKLDCTVNSSPAAKVTWTVNNQAVKLDNNHKINSNNALVFKKISSGDAGLYRCMAYHPGKTEHSRVANVTVRPGIKLADYIINHHKFDKGSTAKLYCTFKGAGPISVKWEKLKAKAMSKNVIPRKGTLTITDIQMEDRGIYACTGSNSFSNYTARINISVFIYPRFVIKPKNTTAVEFESVWLHCNATGDPSPKINWGKEEHGGDVLDPARFIVFQNGTLFIESVLSKDQGRYYCIAGNIANFKQVTISLRVINPPPTVSKNKASAMGRTIAIAVGCAAAYIVLVVGLMIYCKRRRAKHQKKEELTLPIDGEANSDMGLPLQPVNGKPTNYNKMEFPRHDIEALRTLGNGSYGRAFLARASGIKDGERETMVVVKSLMSKDDIQKEDFWRELNALINMDNSYVVGLLGVCRDIEPTYMMFEYLEKGDLKQYLLSCYENGRSTLTSSQKLSLCSNVVAGMNYLACNNFVHKDVAARNCMVTKDLQVKIGFLNLSYDLYNSEYYRFNNILIPLRWMAPEAIFNDDFTEKSDLWSFGVLVWEIYMLGQTPFEDHSDEEVLKCIKDDLRLPKPDNCPDSMANIMTKCWDESPDERPTFDKLNAEISEIAVDTHL